MNLGRENGTTEFKESLGQLDKRIRSLSAMLNRHRGGTVYFGVDDDGRYVGEALMVVSNRFAQMHFAGVPDFFQTTE